MLDRPGQGAIHHLLAAGALSVPGRPQPSESSSRTATDLGLRGALLGWATPIPVFVEISELPAARRPLSDDPDFGNR